MNHHSQEAGQQTNRLPIVYSPRYNTSFYNLEKLHEFDAQKYAKVFAGLCGGEVRLNLERCHVPTEITVDELRLVHSNSYLETLDSSKTIAQIIELRFLSLIPAHLLDRILLQPMRMASKGTIIATSLALEHGWAINLSGGYHHAKADRGEGFCVYADVPIALKTCWLVSPSLKVLIVDLDAHQGNGNSSILGEDDRVAILDLYMKDEYPTLTDPEATERVRYPVPLEPEIRTQEYLFELARWLPRAIAEHQPQLLVYNAGTDIYEHDKIGKLKVSRQGIIDRDSYVFETAQLNQLPIVMVLSGGYHLDSGPIIAESLNNLFRRGLINPPSGPDEP